MSVNKNVTVPVGKVTGLFALCSAPLSGGLNYSLAARLQEPSRQTRLPTFLRTQTNIKKPASSFSGLKWRADRARTDDLLRDRHVRIDFTVVHGRLQASVVVRSSEDCIFSRR